MAAPTVTARNLRVPAGKKMDDGYQVLIVFALDQDIGFWEKSVTPPGVDGGDAVDTFTMLNVTWRPQAPRQLKTLTEISATVAYDPAVYPQVVALINVPGSVTVHFPNRSSLSFYGFLRTFEPNELSEGEQPEATINLTPTNTDPVTGAEEGPVYTPPPP